MPDDPYADSMWEILRDAILQTLPITLVTLAGLVLAIVFLRRHRMPSVCVIIASALTLAAIYGGFVAQYYIAESAWQNDDGPDAIRMKHLIVAWTLQVMYTVSSGLMLAAVFAWRNGPTTSHAVAISGLASTHSHGGRSEMNHVVQPISKGLYLGVIITSYLLSLLLIIPGYIVVLSAGRNDEQVMFGGLLSCAGFIPAIVAVVFFSILIFKLWKSLPREYARTSPGLAIGLLFVPLFNLYWVFQAYWGWTVDYNKTIRALNVNIPQVSQGLALTVCILAVVSVVPIVGAVVSLVAVILLPIFLNNAIDGVNRLASAMVAPDAGAPATASGL